MARGRSKKSDDQNANESTFDRRRVLDAVGMDELVDEFIKDPLNVSTGQQNFVSTGNIVIDRILGGGFQSEAVTEITSEEGVGKTSLLIDTALGLQKAGVGSAIYDTEHGWNEVMISKRGGRVNTKDPDSILLGRYETIEDVDASLQRTIAHPNLKLFVVDSLQGMAPEALLSAPKMIDTRPGLISAKNQDFLIRALKACQRFNKVLVVVTQLRSKFDWSGKSGPEAAGGWAMRFFASTRMFMRRTTYIKESIESDVLLNSEPVNIGHWVEVTSHKNRVVAPFRKGLAFLRYGEGFDNYQTIFEICKENGIARQTGGGYMKFELKSGMKNIQGFAAARNYVKDNITEIMEELKSRGIDLGL